MISDEKEKLHTDIYGRKPAHEEIGDERLVALKREIGRIPNEERASLLKAIEQNPLLFEASPHTKLLIRSEPFDAKEAAKKLVRYWRKREELFGDRAFKEDVFASPTYEDYLKYYENCEETILDPEMDDTLKAIASDYIRCVNKSKIEAMDSLIAKSHEEDNSALYDAMSRGVDISTDTKLMFLKSEDFVETKAASRMMSYWKMKKQLFGSDDYHKEVILEDVNTERNRFARLLPGTDDHGRSILVVYPDELESDGWTDRMIAQYFWYVAHAFLERKKCRQNGLVILLNYKGGSKDLIEKIIPLRQLIRTILFDCMPIKFRTSHLFLKPLGWQWFLLSFVSRIGNFIQKKVVVHMGTNEQIRYEMEQYYGVSSKQFPCELGGDADLDSIWSTWLEKRRSEGR